MAAADEFAKAMREKRLTDARAIAEQSLTPAQRNATRQAVRALRQARLDETPSLPELVALVDQYREQGDEDSKVVVEMLIQAEHGPQRIRGVGHVAARTR